MKLENQVCSLELAKKLKELGVKQDSIFYHTIFNQGKESEFNGGVVMNISDFYKMSDENYSAFTVAELGEMLPEKTCSQKLPKIGWVCESMKADIGGQNADTEANARAKMLVYLLENKLINPNKL